MSQTSDDLTPRPAPCPSENKAAVIVPSVPDVSIVFDPVNPINTRPQTFMAPTNFSRPIFNRPTAKFEPIIEHEHHPPVAQSPPPVVFGHKMEYHQQYLNHQHQFTQQSEFKQQYVQQQPTHSSPPQHHTCSCHNIKLSQTPHIVPVPSQHEIVSDVPNVMPQPIPTLENSDLKEILEILKHNQSELRQINENNERNRKLSENLLLELQDYKKTITTILNKQSTIETKITDVEGKMNEYFTEIKTMINTNLMNKNNNNNNCGSENREILPKYPNNGKLIFYNRPGEENPNKFILNDCKNSPIFAQSRTKTIERISPVNDIGDQQKPNGDMIELFNKYEIKGALNRRSIDYSVSSLNYLQRYGLLDEHN